jgi:hypothetical protein
MEAAIDSVADDLGAHWCMGYTSTRSGSMGPVSVMLQYAGRLILISARTSHNMCRHEVFRAARRNFLFRRSRGVQIRG